MTLTQPWAGLVASGIKLVENRPRRMVKTEDFGTPFAIHASREYSAEDEARIYEIAPELLMSEWWRLSKVQSAVVAIATIDSIVTGNASRLASDQRRWYFGPVGYVLRDVVALRHPVLCKGSLGFWRLRDDVEADVLAQLDASPGELP